MPVGRFQDFGRPADQALEEMVGVSVRGHELPGNGHPDRPQAKISETGHCQDSTAFGAHGGHDLVDRSEPADVVGRRLERVAVPVHQIVDGIFKA